jgi:hypothetical protein
MTQSMPSSGTFGIAPSNGSIERNRTAAGTVRKCSMRLV